MADLIVRTLKIKTRRGLAASGGHTYRQQPTPNADSSRLGQNQHLHSKSRDDLLSKFEARFKLAEENNQKIHGKSVRSDAVLVIEYFIGASPEAFQRKDFDEKKFFDDALRFLYQKHGKDNVIGMSIHRDETTPHAAAYVVPIDSRGILNCKSFLDGAKKMSKLQDDAWLSFGKPHNLERGLRGSKATHTTVKEFYSKVNSPTPAKPKPLAPISDATISEKIMEVAGFETAHSRATEATLAMAKKQIATLQKRSEIQDAKLKVADLNKQNYSKAITENSDLKAREKSRAADLRELPLIDVLARFGATTNERDKSNFDTEVGRISVNGSKFFNHSTGIGGGGAIDLVMHLHGCDYKAAIATLADTFGNDSAVAAIVANPRAATAAIVAASPARTGVPEDAPTNWAGVRRWLNESRKIALNIIDAFRSQKIIRADERGNAVFVNQDKNGAEIRGKGLQFKGYRGNRGIVIFTKNSDKKTAFITESGTDMMAFAMNPKSSGAGLICSVGGDFGQRTIEQLKALQHKGFQLICVTDNDEAGDAKFRLMKKELEQGGKVILREKPTGRDWQDDMKMSAPIVAKKEILGVTENMTMTM